MSSDMVICTQCDRHHRVADEQCPFCRNTRRPVVRMLNMVGGAVTTVILAACYGSGDYTDKYTYGTGDTTDSGDTGDTGETTTTSDTSDTGTSDTSDTSDTGDTGDTGTGDTGTSETGDTGGRDTGSTSIGGSDTGR